MNVLDKQLIMICAVPLCLLRPTPSPRRHSSIHHAMHTWVCTALSLETIVWSSSSLKKHACFAGKCCKWLIVLVNLLYNWGDQYIADICRLSWSLSVHARCRGLVLLSSNVSCQVKLVITLEDSSPIHLVFLEGFFKWSLQGARVVMCRGEP